LSDDYYLRTWVKKTGLRDAIAESDVNFLEWKRVYWLWRIDQTGVKERRGLIKEGVQRVRCLKAGGLNPPDAKSVCNLLPDGGTSCTEVCRRDLFKLALPEPGD
jgi:hypothetical protein